MRIRYVRTAAVGALLLLAFVAFLPAQKTPRTADALYQEALLKKDAEGDLEGAIGLFSKILSEFPSERRVAGLAQLQIGICYEKLGLAKAEEAYKKVLADFGDQPEAANAARERLSRLTGPEQSGDGGASLILRKMMIPEGLVSPDGEHVATEDLEEGYGIAVYDMRDGKMRTVVKTTEGGSCCYFLHGWSPSSRRIIFEASPTAVQTEELRIVDVDGRNEKLVRRFEGVGILEGGGFSPDEKLYYVCLQRHDLSETVIGRVDLTDGTYVEIKNLGRVSPGALCISPDGEFLAYDTSRAPGEDSDIYVVRADGSDERPVLAGPPVENILGWMPDNRGIVFSSTRSGELALWALALRQGKSVGDPVFIKSIKGYVAFCSFARTGAFHFSEYSGGQDVYHAPIDFVSGKFLSEPKNVEPVFSGRSQTPFWSPDGRYLSYIFLTSQESDPLCQYFLKIYSPSTARTRDILLTFKPDRYIFANGWTSDGQSFLLRGTANGRHGLWRVDAESGECRLETESTSIVAWTEDGRIGFETPGTVGDPGRRVYSLTRRDLRSGGGQEIYKGQPGEIISWVSVSPDGKNVGFKVYDRTRGISRPFVVIPAAGGPEMAKLPDEFSLFYWAPRNFGGLIELKRFSEEKPAELWYHPFGPNATKRPLNFATNPDWRDIVFAPDGKAVAYTTGTKFETTFWRIENYLPAKNDKMTR